MSHCSKQCYPRFITSSNVGPTTLVSASTYFSNYTDHYISDYSNITEIQTELAVAPTTTLPGLEKDYEVTKIKYKDNLTSYKIEHVQVGVDAPDSTPANSKYLILTGTVKSSITTNIHFDLSAFGTYVPGNSPFGPSVPALASLYLGIGQTAPAPMPTSYSYAGAGANNYSANGWSYSQGMAAGDTLTFSAVVFAPNDASLTDLSLVISTDYYGFQTVTTPHENESRRLVEARALPPLLPVPENSTYTMLLAGLGVIGVIRRRRGKA